MRSRRSVLAVVLVVVAGIACGPPTVTPEPSPTDVPTAVPPTSAPTEPPVSPSPVPQCPPPASPPLPVQPASFADYPIVIQQYLSAGGDATLLADTLEGWGVLGALLNADVAGSGTDEVIVVLVDLGAGAVLPPASLFVFGCRSGAVDLLAQDVLPDRGINLLGVSDANGDGLHDVVYTAVSCGAHTCFEQLRILVWGGAGFANLAPDELEMPYPTYTISPGRIEARAGGIGSVGAEPQQLSTEIWEWDGVAFVMLERIWDPPVYRYHALLGGDRALQDESYAAALAAYEQVINDAALREWGADSGIVAPADERAQLTAFALWRILLVDLLLGDAAGAQAAYDQLQAGYPPASAGHDVAAMAATFWVAYQAEGEVSAGCAAVVADAASGSTVLDFFNGTYGYANPWWEPADLCPFGP